MIEMKMHITRLDLDPKTMDITIQVKLAGDVAQPVDMDYDKVSQELEKMLATNKPIRVIFA
jgi:hypothetical protein